MAIQNAPVRTAVAKTNAADRFKIASEDTPTRLITSLVALEKQGKSHFALTSPGPIGVINIDIGLEGVVGKFRKEGKEIYTSDYRLRLPKKGTDINIVAEEATKVWEQILEDYEYAINNFRTTLIDTGTEAYDLLRLAKFGKLDQVKPHHYGPVNAQFREIYRMAYSSDSNLIVTHKMKKEYVDDKATGGYERAGYGDTGFQVQVEARCYRVPMDERDGKDDLGFRMQIEECRQNAECQGTVLEGPLLSFQGLATTVFPDTNWEDWE